MSAIPYTVERRPDTGVNNVQLGMWLFLASEAMLFAGLFSAYFMLRAGAPEPWLPLAQRRHGLNVLRSGPIVRCASSCLIRLVALLTCSFASSPSGFKTNSVSPSL